MTVTRERLYEQVWVTPMSRLARDYGVSDSALAKTCRKLGVPLPPRGHWAKLQHGKKVPPRPPLPKEGKDGRETATVTRTAPIQEPGPPDPVVDKVVQLLTKDENRVKVADQLRNPHPAVKAPQAPRQGATTRGTTDPAAGRTLPVNVSDSSRGRALRILDALCKALEALGHPVTAAGASIQGETVPIAITEKQDRTPHVATAAELARRKDYSWTRLPAWDHSPSGKLSIHSECYVSNRSDLRKRWSDGRGVQLEDMLDDVLLGLVAIGAGLRRQSDERRTEHERFVEQQRQRAEAERLTRVEAARVKGVLDSARSLADAEVVRRLIEAVESRATQDEGEPVPGLDDWLARAKAVAAGLDPTSDGVKEMLARHEAEAQRVGNEKPQPRWGG